MLYGYGLVDKVIRETIYDDNVIGRKRRHPQGFLFRSTESIKKEHPEVPAFEEYDELLEAIKKSL